MKKLLALVLAAVMCLMACAALADTDMEYVKAKGTLVVGVTDFAPMDYKDADGNWIGFDADLARAFAETLGVEAVFVEIDWDNKILEIDAQSIDCIWNGMTLTAEVDAALACTAPYMNNAQVVVIKDAEKVAAIEAATTDEEIAAVLADMVFAVEAGSAGEEVGTECGLQVTAVTSQAAALMEAAAGTSDGAIIDLLMAAAMTGEGTGYPELVATVALNEEEYVIGFRKGSDLADACNDFLAASTENGVIDALVAKYIVAE